MSETTESSGAPGAGPELRHPDAEAFAKLFTGRKIVPAQPALGGGKDDFWPRVLAYSGNDDRRILRRKTADKPVSAATPMFYAGLAHFDLSRGERDLGFVVETPHFRAETVRVHLGVEDCEPGDGTATRTRGADPRLRQVRAEASGERIAIAFTRSAADNLGGLTVSYLIAAFGEVDLPADARAGDKAPRRPGKGVADPQRSALTQLRMIAGSALFLATLALAAATALWADRLGHFSLGG